MQSKLFKPKHHQSKKGPPLSYSERRAMAFGAITLSFLESKHYQHYQRTFIVRNIPVPSTRDGHHDFSSECRAVGSLKSDRVRRIVQNDRQDEIKEHCILLTFPAICSASECQSTPRTLTQPPFAGNALKIALW
jgi:hypothetical protein